MPFEQTEQFGGSDDTTVDVNIIVPAGWTNAACGSQFVNINTVDTEQHEPAGRDRPRLVVRGADGGQPRGRAFQWAAGRGTTDVADSAQWFSFSVTTPSPLAKTSYDGTNGTEGFIIDQTYASGEIMHWIPSAGFTGTPPAGSTTSVATGLKRTVAAVPVTVTSDYPPMNSPASTRRAPRSGSAGRTTNAFGWCDQLHPRHRRRPHAHTTRGAIGHRRRDDRDRLVCSNRVSDPAGDVDAVRAVGSPHAEGVRVDRGLLARVVACRATRD